MSLKWPANIHKKIIQLDIGVNSDLVYTSQFVQDTDNVSMGVSQLILEFHIHGMSILIESKTPTRWLAIERKRHGMFTNIIHGAV